MPTTMMMMGTNALLLWFFVLTALALLPVDAFPVSALPSKSALAVGDTAVSWSLPSFALAKIQPANHRPHQRSTRIIYGGRPLRVSSLEEDTRVVQSELVPTDDSKKSVLLSAKDGLSEDALGLLALLTVPLLWGTYAPAVRVMYELETPVPGFVFSAMYFSVAALTTLGLSVMSQADENGDKPLLEKLGDVYKDVPTLVGGFELGSYVLIANLFQVVGLETVASSTSGFLMQMTTVLVPLVSAVLAGSLKEVDGRTWLACAVAFAGIAVMNLDPSQGFSSITSILSSFSGGEGLVLCSALCYTMNVIRISDYAGVTSPLRLTTVKATVEATLSWLIVGSLWFLSSNTPDLSLIPQDGLMAFAERTGEGISDFFTVFGTRIEEGTVSAGLLAKMGGVIAWTGVMCTAFVVSMQSYGQRLVKASDANLIYSLQPIFTALFAGLLLGEEMESKGFIGGGLILSAVLLVATKNFGSEEEPTESEFTA